MAVSKIPSGIGRLDVLYTAGTTVYENNIGDYLQLTKAIRPYAYIQILAYEDSYAGGNRRIIDISSFNASYINARYVAFPRTTDIGILRFEILADGRFHLVSSTVNSLFVDTIYGYYA